MRATRALGLILIIVMIGWPAGGSKASTAATSAQNEAGPTASVRVPLKADGLPESFFQAGADTKCSDQIIGYRFVVWLNNQNVAVGFNTSPNCRLLPDRKVDGVLRVLVFDLDGKLKASRDLNYLADGNGELVADGEAMPGPSNTLLVRIESVNLDSEGRQESKSGIRLLDANLKDVAQRDLFLEQTTFVDHDVVTESGSPFGGHHAVSILGGSELKEIAHRDVDWPAGAMDRKFGEHGFAFMLCGQELRPGEYTNTSVVHDGARIRCTLNALGENNNAWTVPLRDGESASIIGLLTDGSVAGQIHAKDNNAGQIVIWRKGTVPEYLPWLPSQFDGTIDTATGSLSRYASFATYDSHPCNPIVKILGTPCDEGGNGRWFVFDRFLQTPIVNREFPKNGRAALAPDGLHYASFEANELRIYSLALSK
ncbi:MAG: hypothetical protein WAL45_17250 [Terracidiphilus sp.]